MNTKKYKDLMIEALKRQLNNVSVACKEIGIARKTHYLWLEKDPEYKKEVDSIDEFVLDWAENALKRQIENGNVIATIFFLKCRGKSRGYIEKTESEIVHKGEGFQLNIIDGNGKLGTVGKAEGSS